MNLSLDTGGIDVLARGFKVADKERPMIIARSINRTLPKARTLSGKAVREDLALPAAYVRERFKLQRSNYQKLSGRLTAKGRPILWGRFKFRVTRKGVTARVNKREGRRTARGGFVVPLRAGGTTIQAPAVRVGGRYQRTNSARFKPLYGPDIPEVLNSKLPTVEPEIARYLQGELSKQVERLMRRI